MINRLVCPYSDVHLNNKPHISGKEKNRDCNCANIVKDPEMEILKIQNSEKTPKKLEEYWYHSKIYSFEDRLENGMIKPLLRASSRTKVTISVGNAIPNGKSSQLKPHTGTEFYTLNSITILSNSMMSHNSNAVLNETIKPLLRPQNSKNVNMLQSSKIQPHTGNEAPTTSSITTPKVKLSYIGNISPVGTTKALLGPRNSKSGTMLHSTNILYKYIYTCPSTWYKASKEAYNSYQFKGSSNTSAAGGLNSASSNE
jgi:hypothetical protein